MSNRAQRSFSRGELAPALYARSDQVAYSIGLRTCRNFIVKREGGVDNRPGTDLVGQAAADTVRLIRFEFNDAQTYVLEFTNLQVRFIQNGLFLGAPYSVVTPYLAADVGDLHVTQSADVLTIVHPNYPPATLSRYADTNWVYATITFAPSIAAPTGLTSTTGTPGVSFVSWVVTAIDATTGQESVASAAVGVIASINAPTSIPHQVLQWTAVAGASSYNVYKAYLALGTGTIGTFGFVGSSVALQFADSGLTPDTLSRPPEARNPFSGVGNYPGAVNYYQGRQVFGGPNNNPATIYTSRSGDYQNFTVSSPTEDDDAITFTLVSKKVNIVRHFVDTGTTLIVLTSGAEWSVDGDAAGVLRPTDVNARHFSTHGCSTLAPIQLGKRVLYVHARRAILRDLQNIPYQGFHGSDLTIFSSHLFDGHTIVDLCYQEVPHSIVWAVRDDGVLLGLTDVADQEIQAWHRHDTVGSVTACCVVPEGGEDRLYLAVLRNGRTYIERMASRFYTDIQDAVHTDSTVTFDGRNTNPSLTMRISGGTTWAYDELLTITDNAGNFAPSDAGSTAVFVTAPDGTVVQFQTTVYVSATTMQGFAQMTVPVSLQNVSVSTWAYALPTMSGLGHLNGLAVGVFADGYVVASPNNPSVTTQVVVSGGSITLDRPYAYIHAGLPYVSDLETLDIDTPQGASLKALKMKIDRISAEVIASRGLFGGSGAPASDSVQTPLTEWKLPDSSDIDDPVSVTTGTIGPLNISNKWSYEGRIFMRQVDPVPCTILAVIPTGTIQGG